MANDAFGNISRGDTRQLSISPLSQASKKSFFDYMYINKNQDATVR